MFSCFLYDSRSKLHVVITYTTFFLFFYRGTKWNGHITFGRNNMIIFRSGSFVNKKYTLNIIVWNRFYNIFNYAHYCYVFLFVSLLLSLWFVASILLPLFFRRPPPVSLGNKNRILYGPWWSVLYYLLQPSGLLEYENTLV